MVYLVASINDAKFIDRKGDTKIIPAGYTFLAASSDLSPINVGGTQFVIGAGQVATDKGMRNVDDLIVKIV